MVLVRPCPRALLDAILRPLPDHGRRGGISPVARGLEPAHDPQRRPGVSRSALARGCRSPRLPQRLRRAADHTEPAAPASVALTANVIATEFSVTDTVKEAAGWTTCWPPASPPGRRAVPEPHAGTRQMACPVCVRPREHFLIIQSSRSRRVVNLLNSIE